jgi:hypothetical protein
MSNRTTYEARNMNIGQVALTGQCVIGAAGAVTELIGNGLASIAKTATGVYTLTLQDGYRKLLSASAALISLSNRTAKTCVTGTPASQSATFAAKAATTSGDHVVITDTNGNKWGISLDVTGSAPEPTGAVWASIPAGRKVHVDISAQTTGGDVAAAVETAVDALTGFTALIVSTVSVAAIGFVQVNRAPVAAIVSYKSDETAVGSTTVAEVTAGVQTSVNVTNNTLTIPSHGFFTGRSVALSIGAGSLPAGLSATSYFLIVVDANTIKFASSLANAEAGTAVDITDYGTSAQTMTLTPNANVGSGVACVEVSAYSLANKTIELACYDYAAALVQPANGSVLHFNLEFIDTSVPLKGE